MPPVSYRTTGLLCITAALTMVVGALLLGVSGADLDSALAARTTADYLSAVPAVRGLLIANLVLWIVGVLLWGGAGVALSQLPNERSAAALFARYCYQVGIPLVVVAYTAWLSVVVRLGGLSTPDAVMMGDLIGWFASRADWIATILVVGVGPFLLAYSGQGTWAPRWLLVWGGIAAFAALLNAIAMLTGGAGLVTYGFVIIPVGITWMIAAGIVLLRRSPASTA